MSLNRSQLHKDKQNVTRPPYQRKNPNVENTLEIELDDDAIAHYRKMGYIVEELEEFAEGGEGDTDPPYLQMQTHQADNTRVNMPILPAYLDKSQALSMEEVKDIETKTAQIAANDEAIRQRPYVKKAVTTDYIKSLNSKETAQKNEARKGIAQTYKHSNPTEVAHLQEQLGNLNYDLGDYGVDGQWGAVTEKAMNSKIEDDTLSTKTINKYYNKYKNDDDGEYTARVVNIQNDLVQAGYLDANEVDGRFGDKTKDAVQKFNKVKEPNAYFFDKIPKQLKEERCAKGMCQILEDNSVVTEALGVKYKNAWDIQENMANKGNSTSIYNIYEDPRFKNVKSGDELVALTREVKKNSQTSAGDYKVGDIVGVFWPNSSHHDEVLGSKTKNTHVGFISGIEGGVPMITHNVLGHVKTEPYSNVATAWIQRPNEDIQLDSDQKYTPKVVSSDNKSLITAYERKKERPLTANEKKLASTIMTRAETNSQNLPELLGSTVDPQWLNAATVGITGVESGIGLNAPRSTEDMGGLRGVTHSLKGTNPADISLGVGKTKYTTLDPFAKQYFGINSEKDLADDNKATDIVSYNLIKYYDTFKDYSQQFPELELTENDIRNMAILSHNRGDSKLLTLGRRSDDGEYQDGRNYLEEVKGLRDMSRPYAKQKDVSATNYKYLDKVIPGAGTGLYNLQSDGEETYISKVNRYINDIYGTPVEFIAKRQHGGESDVNVIFETYLRRKRLK